MRTTNELMDGIRQREHTYRNIRTLRRKLAAEMVAVACSVLGMLLVFCFLPQLQTSSEQAQIRQYGSMVRILPTVGYVLIALLAFVLGVTVTMLGIHWKQCREKEREL